jgi:hypothetical protein
MVAYFVWWNVLIYLISCRGWGEPAARWPQGWIALLQRQYHPSPTAGPRPQGPGALRLSTVEQGRSPGLPHVTHRQRVRGRRRRSSVARVLQPLGQATRKLRTLMRMRDQGMPTSLWWVSCPVLHLTRRHRESLARYASFDGDFSWRLMID